jgi:hypothetical protein
MWAFSRGQKKEAERNSNPPLDIDIADIRNNLLRTVNSAVIAAKYMEIVTALSDNINGKIDPQYQDLVQAITARSGNVIATESKAHDEEATRVKSDDELRAEILARTWIGLDGDVAMILPKSRVGIDPEVLQLHKANVDVAVQNWRYFLDTMIKGVQILAGYTLPAR